MKDPLVSVVIVNYNGKHFLSNCLASLSEIDFPSYEIVMVDNASSDGSIKLIEEDFPSVKLIKSEKNLGFAGGCNLGVKHAAGKYIAFLNTDTRVDKHWLRGLVSRIEKDKKIAAVNSKVLLYYPFFELSILSDLNPLENFSQTLNFIAVGVFVESAILDDQELQLLMRYRSGFYTNSKEEMGCWTNGNAKILIPFNPLKEEVGVTLIIRSEKFLSDTRLLIKAANKTMIKRTMKPYETKKIHFRIKTSYLKNNSLFEVQNAGVAVFKTGYGRDRGAVVKGGSQFYETDSDYYNKAQEIHAFSGASVLLRKSVFENYGGFDESFFMYYEDVDLSLRFRRKGLKIYYEPDSVVYHIHSGSSIEWSTFFNYHVEKNHLAILIKHFSLIGFFKKIVRYSGGIIISLAYILYWQLKNDWSSYYSWKEKYEYRRKVIGWVSSNFFILLWRRFEINRTQQISRKEINEVHY